MKKVTIKYNPYLINTEIKVDGKKIKPNSALNIGKKRLQEWVELLPQNLLDEYRDSNIELEFTGNASDYEDLKSAFAAMGNSQILQTLKTILIRFLKIFRKALFLNCATKVL